MKATVQFCPLYDAILPISIVNLKLKFYYHFVTFKKSFSPPLAFEVLKATEIEKSIEKKNMEDDSKQ